MDVAGKDQQPAPSFRVRSLWPPRAPKGNDQRGMTKGEWELACGFQGWESWLENFSISIWVRHTKVIYLETDPGPTSSWGNWSLCLAAEDDFLPVWGPNREFPGKVSNWISLLLLFRFYTFARVLSWWQPAHHMTIRDQRPLYIILASYGVHEYGVQIRVVRSDNSSSRH